MASVGRASSSTIPPSAVPAAIVAFTADDSVSANFSAGSYTASSSSNTVTVSPESPAANVSVPCAAS